MSPKDALKDMQQAVLIQGWVLNGKTKRVKVKKKKKQNDDAIY